MANQIAMNALKIDALHEYAQTHGMALRTHEDGPAVIHTVVDPSTASVHYLTGYSCDCPIFCLAGMCPHYALLLVAFGWIPIHGRETENVA